MSSQKIDNKNLYLKIKLREEVLKEQNTVLDLFHGEGHIWANIIKNNADKTIKIDSIDKYKKSADLKADANKIIQKLDLSKYQILDCDCYSDPVTTIEKIYENETLKKGTVIVYTLPIFVPQKIVYYSFLGITKKMYSKSKMLFKKLGQETFYQFLYRKGIKKVIEYEKGQIKYGYFVV